MVSDGVAERFFALLGEGAQILKRLDEDSAGFFSDLSRLREILSIMGEDSSDYVDGSVFFSLDDKEKSEDSLRRYLQYAENAMPKFMAPFEAKNIGELLDELGVTSYTVKNGTRDDTISMMLHFVESAPEFGVDRDEAAKIEQMLDELQNENLSEKHRKVTAGIVAKLNEIERRINVGQEKSRETGDATEYEQAVREWNEAEKEYRGAWTAINSEWKSRRDSIAAQASAHGLRIVSTLVESSPVTKEQADKWASEQDIDASASAKLKRGGYSAKEARSDMAEFYRMVGGKCPAITLSSTRNKRASASGINKRRGEKTINIGSGFNKRVLWHEMGHHLEFDALCYAAANGFLLKRRVDDKVYSLRELTGNKGYRADEVAYKDSFINPYVGKHYRDGYTEVFSMGMENLCSPETAYRFAAKDPEHFALITGYIQSKMTPAQSAKIGMHQDGRTQQKQQNKNDEAVYSEIIAKMATRARITPDGWFDSFDEEWKGKFRRMVLAKYEPDDVYIGSFGSLRVFQGIFLNMITGRKSKGYRVYHDLREGQVNASAEWRASIHGDKELLLAFLFAANQQMKRFGVSDINNLARYNFCVRPPFQPDFIKRFKEKTGLLMAYGDGDD